jgi:two-component system NtrC family sensor kinase
LKEKTKTPRSSYVGTRSKRKNPSDIPPVSGDTQPLAAVGNDLQDLEQVLQACAELRTSGNIDIFLEKFTLPALRFLGFQNGLVVFNEGQSHAVRSMVIKGKALSAQFELDARFIQNILRKYGPFSSEHPSQIPGFEQQFAAYGDFRQLLAVPITAGDQQDLGLLFLLDRTDGLPIQPHHTSIAQALANEMASALHIGQILRLSENHRLRAENLVGLALEMGSSLNLPDLVRSFGMRAASMTRSRAWALALANGNSLEMLVLSDSARDHTREHRRMLTGMLQSWLASSSRQIVSGTCSQLFGEKAASQFGWNRLTAARISASSGEVLGVLLLADYPAELSRDDQQTLQAIIGHASVALENSRLFSRITQSNRQWSEIFDSLQDLVVVHDDDHRIMRVNRALAEFLATSPPDLIGMPISALLTRGLALPQPCPFCLPAVVNGEFIHPVLGRTYLVSTSRTHGALDEGMQTVHVLKDVTDRREAERRYRELFDNLQEGVFFSTPEGRFTEVNDALVRMLGYSSREELLAVEEHGSVYVSEVRHASAKGNDPASQGTREVILRHKSGSLIYALENATPVRDEHGVILQYRGLLLDITENKRFQAQLQRERDFNLQILNNTESMILVVDTAGLISYANRRCYSAGDFAPGTLLGQRILNLVTEPDRANWNGAFAIALDGDPVDSFEIHLLRANGSIGTFSVNLSPMRVQDAVNSVVVVMTDITELALIQSQLANTEKLAAIGQLVSGVAHEVNNPLTAILGFADLLQSNTAIPDDIRQELNIIMQEAQRTKEIVQNLLSFARRNPRHRQEISVNEVLRRTLSLRVYDFSSHGVQVSEDLAEDLTPINGDANQLQQVFLNILNNAYDAIRGAEREGRIQLISRQVEDSVEVIFRDNGPGVSHLDRIFDPFFTTKEVGQGTGLGLSICFGIVQEHGGDIHCYNNLEGAGATFVVRLPLLNRRAMSMAAGKGTAP